MEKRSVEPVQRPDQVRFFAENTIAVKTFHPRRGGKDVHFRVIQGWPEQPEKLSIFQEKPAKGGDLTGFVWGKDVHSVDEAWEEIKKAGFRE